MTQIALKIIKSALIIFILTALIILLIPFDLFDMKQAQRIAKWKSVYEQLEYAFSLVKLYEGDIIPSADSDGKAVSDDYIIKRIAPYMNLKTDNYLDNKYKYRKMNGRFLSKTSQFIFDKFLQRKDGVYVGIRQNSLQEGNNNPSYLMLVDINGNDNPNRIGKDIFFVNLHKDNISALGKGKDHTALKSSCSPIGGGFYCSEYYLLGGKF